MDTTQFQQYTKPGYYRCYPKAWNIREPRAAKDGEPQSQSAAISIQFMIHQQYDTSTDSWGETWTPGWIFYCDTWVIGRDGEPNERSEKTLRDCKLWFGDWNDLAGDPPNEFVILDVREETGRDGKTRMSVKWLNPNADKPRISTGQMKPADTSKVSEYAARFNAAGRARAAAAGGPPAAPGAVGASTPATTPAGLDGPAATPAATPAAASATPPPVHESMKPGPIEVDPESPPF